MAFWVTFKDNKHKAGTVSGYSEGITTKEAAKAKAEEVTGCEVDTVQILPYGASPIIYAPEKDQHGFFCLHGANCAGRSSCPRSYACSE